MFGNKARNLPRMLSFKSNRRLPSASFFKSESDSVLGYDYGLLLFIQLIIHISGSITGVGLFLILILISNMNKLEMIRANHNSLERVNEKSH